MLKGREAIIESAKNIEHELGRQAVLCFSQDAVRTTIRSTAHTTVHIPMDQSVVVRHNKQPVIVGYYPPAIDVSILRALGSSDPKSPHRVASYIIPSEDGPRTFLLARNPNALHECTGYVQTTDSEHFKHINDDSDAFPWSLFYDGEHELPVLDQTPVTARDLRQPVARIPASIRLSEVLMNTALIQETPDQLYVEYQDTRPSQHFDFHYLHGVTGS